MDLPARLNCHGKNEQLLLIKDVLYFISIVAFLKEIYLDYSPLSGLHIVLGERDSYLSVKKNKKLSLYLFFLSRCY